MFGGLGLGLGLGLIILGTLSRHRNHSQTINPNGKQIISDATAGVTV